MFHRCLMVLSCATLLFTAAPVLAQGDAPDDPEYVVQPGAGSSVDAGGGGYFVLEGRAGRSVKQSIGVRNDGQKPLTILLASVDAQTAQFGGVSYSLEGDEKQEVSTWIEIPRDKVVLKPGASITIPFTVSVPVDAGPGVHLGGISAYVPGADAPAEDDQGEDDQAGAAIVVRTRRVLAVQVEIAGERKTTVDISGVQADARPDGVYLEVMMSNNGTELTKGVGQIELTDENFSEEFLLDTFVPGTSIAYPIRWRDSVPNGDYGVTVRLEYEPDKVAEFEGTFTVGDEVQDELDERQVGGNPNGGGNKTILILVALSIVLLGFALYMRRQLAAARDEARIAREGADNSEG